MEATTLNTSVVKATATQASMPGEARKPCLLPGKQGPAAQQPAVLRSAGRDLLIDCSGCRRPAAERVPMSKRCAKACGRPPRQAGSAPAEFSFFLRHRHKMERASREQRRPSKMAARGRRAGRRSEGKGRPLLPTAGTRLVRLHYGVWATRLRPTGSSYFPQQSGYFCKMQRTETEAKKGKRFSVSKDRRVKAQGSSLACH